MQHDDTILAVSSPPGATGVRAIVRLSGPGAWEIVRALIDTAPDARVGWREVRVRIASMHVSGGLMLFKSPQSFTGEDVAELHVPNAPALVALLMESLLHAAQKIAVPLRLAEPGEFTARAFFNGKVDLTEAEGIAETIHAGNVAQLRAAASLRGGDLHRWAAVTAEKLANLLALIEAGIDFAEEEDIHFVESAQALKVLEELCADIEKQLGSARRLARCDHLPTVVFVGVPNVGKSSLINALAASERSIVSDVAGTTRDMLSAILHTPQGDLRLLDVPGEEEITDALHGKMMAAREQAILEADLVMEVVAGSQNPRGMGELPVPHVVVRNKVDLGGEITPNAWQTVSAKTGAGIDALRAALLQKVLFHGTQPAGHIELNQRHRTILTETHTVLQHAATLVREQASVRHPEFLAAELRRALDLLGQLTGTISPDEVLGRIFATFCLGK